MKYADFINKFPEFKSVDNNKIIFALDEAKLQINSKIWGKYYEVGILYLTAHILAIGGNLNADDTISSAPLKEIASKSVGALSISYTSGKTGFENDSGSYFLTKYGQRFLELKKLITPHFGLVK